MSILDFNIECCKQKIQRGELWLLQEIKGYTNRKLYKAHCPICDEDIVLYVHKNTATNKVYPEIIRGINAVKLLYKEKKRRLQVFANVETDKLYGWIYGINSEVRNKDGNVVQIRQYASDFKGNKALVKKVLKVI